MDQNQGIAVTPQELQELVRKQADLIGSLQTTKLLLEGKVVSLQQENTLLKTALESVEQGAEAGEVS